MSEIILMMMMMIIIIIIIMIIIIIIIIINSDDIPNIRMDLEEIGINAGNWVDSAQDRNYWRALVNAALNLRVP